VLYKFTQYLPCYNEASYEFYEDIIVKLESTVNKIARAAAAPHWTASAFKAVVAGTGPFSDTTEPKTSYFLYFPTS